MKKISRLTIFLLVFFSVLILMLGSNLMTSHHKNWARVHFIDVGYGDAILIQLPDSSTILIDAGPKKSANKLMAYLSDQGIKKINTAIITHPHQNHFEGFFPIVRKMRIDHIFINGDQNAEEGYADLINILKRKKIPIQILKRGSTIDSLPEPIHVTILNPENLSGNTNENSIAIFLRYGNIGFVFTADIDVRQQDQILDSFPEIKKAQIVQIPHHGGPVSHRFGQYFPHAYFIISTGKNKWGLPRSEDLKKIEGAILRTDKNGSIIIETNGETAWIKSKTN